jgi:3-deoxy-7-phosphoheptulonate synthase
MIIQLDNKLTAEQKTELTETISAIGFKIKDINTQNAEYLIAIGAPDFDIRTIGNMSGVADVFAVNDTHELVSNKWRITPTIIDLGNGVTIGGNDLCVMAGPCSVENEKQVKEIAEFLNKNEIGVMRGGVFKPRSSPYAFRGAGIDGLKYFSAVCKAHGIKIITEVMHNTQIDQMSKYVDIFQVGARNSQNFNLLDALGKTEKPVMIKRGISGTLDELLYSAEYIFSGGNEKIILCERGIRTFEKEYRNTLDLNAIPTLKAKTHLPVIVDPSHGTGKRHLVETMALAGIISGADGIMVEIHKTPDTALSDGAQSLTLRQAETLFGKMKATWLFRKKMNSVG